jgi:hypothetical protein
MDNVSFETWGSHGSRDVDVLGCDTMSNCRQDFSPEYGDSIFLKNVSIYLRVHMVS